MQSSEMPSIIFVTLADGEYSDRWSSDLLPVGVSSDRSGIRELTWDGQRSGLRDDLVGPGTLVALRPNFKSKFFKLVGRVLLKTQTRQREGRQPAEYKLVIEMAANPVRINKLETDRFTHNSVLRVLGYPIETGAMPHGIYAK